MQQHDNQPLTDFNEYPEEVMLSRAKEFLQTSQRRHSIRSFSNRQVPKEIIETCIKAAGTAPSGTIPTSPRSSGSSRSVRLL